MRTIVHVGQHKTGTTSIQHFLQDRRDTLIEAGLYIPDTLLGFDNPSHFLLNVHALDPGRESTAKIMLKDAVEPGYFETLADRLREDIARHYALALEHGCSEVLWSNEGLFLLDSETEYARLRALFDEHSDSVDCVCCFRDRDSFRQSYQRQLQSLGLPLSDDPSSYRYLEADSWLLDYDRKRALLEAVFDRVMSLDYDPADMIRVFMTAIGHPVSADTAALRLNTTD